MPFGIDQHFLENLLLVDDVIIVTSGDIIKKDVIDSLNFVQ